MIESLDIFIKKQNNVVTMVLFLTLMCWFIPYAKYLAIIIIPIYAVWFIKGKKTLMSEVELHYIKNHTEEYERFKASGYKVSALDINISPFVKSEYFVETMFDRLLLEKCDQVNKVNFVVVIMIMGLAGTVLLITVS